MNVLDVLASAAPGAITEAAIEIGNLASGAPISIPLVIAKGHSPGPCLWINGQVHGDELNGIFAALEFVRGVSPADITGTIVVSATANPFALNARLRRTPQDFLDLDQSYPGHSAGSTTERIAAAFFEIVNSAADHFVSLHTTSATFDSVVFAAYKEPKHDKVSERLMLRCMAQFRPVFTCVMPEHPRAADATGVTAGSIDYQLLNAGKLAFMIELGSGGRFTPRHVKQGVEGLLGTAALLGLLPQDPLGSSSLTKVTEFRGLTTGKGGLFRPDLRPGCDRQEAGARYGRVIDLYGHTAENATLDKPYRLIAVRSHPTVDTGDRLAIAALNWLTIEI